MAGALRRLCELVLADPAAATAHSAIRRVVKATSAAIPRNAPPSLPPQKTGEGFTTLPTTMTTPAPTIGIVTALPYECVAVEYLLDDVFEWAPRHVDSGRYAVGTMPAFGGGVHQIALCQAQTGTNRAAIRATMLKLEFPSIEHIIMVGIAGGAPDPQHPDKHVRLGDIVVSNEYGVVQFDNIKDDEEIQHRHPPRASSPSVLAADAVIARAEVRREFLWERFLARIEAKGDEWKRPPTSTDVLRSRELPGGLSPRELEHPADPKRIEGKPRVFRGVIGSSNSLLKRSERRDYLRDRFDVRAIEMESSGIADATWELRIGYFVIRGICDYCNSDKDNVWHYYASAVSAAYCRALIEQLPPSSTRHVLPAEQIDTQELHLPAHAREGRHLALAARLLCLSKPAPISSFFHQPHQTAVEAEEVVARVPRTLSSLSDRSGSSPAVSALLTARAGNSAIVAPPGYGKTFAVWRAAHEVLEQRKAIPIFLPVGGMSASNEAVALLDSAGPLRFEDLRQDPEVVFVLDGWSEFPRAVEPAAADAERRRLLALLGERPVLATSRVSTDPRFTWWALMPLERTCVLGILAKRGSAVPSPVFHDVLRHPLALLLYLFLDDGRPVSLGQLLDALHRRISTGQSAARVLNALSRVAFELTSRRAGLSLAAFEEALGSASTGDPGLAAQIERLGTLSRYADRIVPFHDSYWEWLAGIGAMRFGLPSRVAADLYLRPGIELALESGEQPATELVETALRIDLRFAAMLIERLSPWDASAPDLRERLGWLTSQMLSHEQVAIRYRALQATRYECSVPFSEIAAAVHSLGEHGHRLQPSFDGKRLWDLRHDAVPHLADPIFRLALVEAICTDGDPRWIEWLRERARTGTMPLGESVGAALACTDDLPPWIADVLLGVLAAEGWRLRRSMRRGVNRPLAAWGAANYEALATAENSAWYHLNDLLLACGDESLCEVLFSSFERMAGLAQERLGYLIVELTEPWIARFQEIAFREGVTKHHYKLLEVVTPVTRESTARSWIGASDWRLQELGWRTLAALHQNEMVPELLAALPESFDGVEGCSPLVAIQQLADPPQALIGELWRRMKGMLGIKVGQDVVYALAAIRPAGLLSIVHNLNTGRFPLPGYHRMRFLELLQKWEQTHNRTIITSNTDWGSMTYGEWLMLQPLRGPASADDMHFLLDSKPYQPRVVAPAILDRAARGDPIAMIFVTKLGRAGCYHEPLVDHLLEYDSDKLLDLFGDVLSSFPEQRLLELVSVVAAGPEPSPRIRRLLKLAAQSPSGGHRRFHRWIIIEAVMHSAGMDLEVLDPAAKLLASLPPEEALRLRTELPPLPDVRVVALARRAEDLAGRIVVGENLQWLS